MEKILKRLTWLVSATAFIIFGCIASAKFLETEGYQKLVTSMLEQEDEGRHSCIRGETYDQKQCSQFISMKESLLRNMDLAIKYRGEYDKLTRNYFFLTLGTPFTLFFLFFSVRWVLTERAPWQRSITKTSHVAQT